MGWFMAVSFGFIGSEIRGERTRRACRVRVFILLLG
jgi:hypothetical protein